MAARKTNRRPRRRKPKGFRFRRADNGQFTTEERNRRHPRTTIRERR